MLQDLKGNSFQLVGCLLTIYLQREEELLSCWWKEYAECSEGPKERPRAGTKSDSNLKASTLGNTLPTKLYEVEEERVGVPVKGGLYEVIV